MLVPEVLEQKLKKAFEDLQPTIESELNSHFSDKMLGHSAIGVNEEANMGGEIETESVNSIYTVQEKTDKWCVENQQGNLNTTVSRAEYKDKLWTEVSKNWAKSLSEHISKDITMTMSKELAPAMAEIITDYIKSATMTVVIPPGVGTTLGSIPPTPNILPMELQLSPVIPDAVRKTFQKLPSFGGLI
jgi:hypothetical protein